MRIRLVEIDDHGEIIELDYKNPKQSNSVRNAVGYYAIKQIRQELLDRDIIFTRPGEPYEVSIASWLSTSRKQLRRWTGEPLIIHDHHDTAGLTSVIRSAILKPYVIGVLKPRLYRHYNLHNTPVVQFTRKGHTYHTTILLKALPPWFRADEWFAEYRPLEPFISEELVTQKVRLCPGYGHSWSFNPGWHAGPELDRDREYDAYFNGTVLYDNIPVVLHRILCINQMREWNYAGGNCDFNPPKTTWRAYMADGLRNTRVSPSPWGYGASCFRDNETLMAGAVLVKPDSSFVKMWPDIFDPDLGLYVQCALDFADLPDIIRNVKDHWPAYRQMREEAWEYILKHHHNNVTADFLAASLHYFGEQI